MSIQPNRVIHRIIDQVDQSDWPAIRGRLIASPKRGEMLRFYRVPRHPRYATPLHFWVHALREELKATERRADLVAVACHAEGRVQSAVDWFAELRAAIGAADADPCEVESALGIADVARVAQQPDAAHPIEIYRMLESPCRRSSVAAAGDSLMAHFWAHGAAPSWRRSA